MIVWANLGASFGRSCFTTDFLGRGYEAGDDVLSAIDDNRRNVVATFWEHQDQARKLTRRLVFLTWLSAVFICGGVSLIVFSLVGDVFMSLVAGAAIGAVILVRGAYVRLSLRGGGVYVA
ncbi:MAG: hypothetical protein CMH50_01295, partial [Myxococcales bacterium]|nr:hypothetical protein [Myxococcales bacterium]